MPLLKQTLNQVRDKIFQNVHSNHLIYNTCWEDPRADRVLLELDKQSEVVMITSAGCNALDYLMDDPAHIACIDMNSRQNALLALKIAVIKHGTYEDLWQYFGLGKHPRAMEVYANTLRKHLAPYAQEYWDRQILAFNRKSFYFFGTSGKFAWFFNQYIDLQPGLRKQIDRLLGARSLDEQRDVYSGIESRLINGLVRWILNRHFTMTLLGVPRAQRQLISSEYPGGMAGFIQDALRHIFTELPIHDNYFWRLYLTGRYTPTCCPEYLNEDNYETLRERVDRISLHTMTVNEYLLKNPKEYSHYILLDHQDWLAAHNVEALNAEWQAILENTRAHSRVLLRSAAQEVDFFPKFVQEGLEFQTELTDIWHPQDRVGTYGSTYLGLVKEKSS